MGWLAGRGSGQGGMAGQMGGWLGRVAGQIWWLAESGGGPSDRRGVDLRSKECSGVNIEHIQPLT